MLRKTLLSLLLAACFAIVLNAQTEKGAFLIGLNTGPGLGFSPSKGYSIISFAGEAKAGYFIKNNLLVGAEYGVYHNSLNYYEQESSTLKGYSVGLFARKYYDLKNLPKWKPFIEVGTGYNYLATDYPNPNSAYNATRNSYYLGAEVGIAYFINEKFSLNLSFDNQMNFGSHGVRQTNGIKFGINYSFNGKSKN